MVRFPHIQICPVDHRHDPCPSPDLKTPATSTSEGYPQAEAADLQGPGHSGGGHGRGHRSPYPKGDKGRPPIPLETMRRIYFMQQWFGHADPAMEEAWYDPLAERIFAHNDL